MKPGMIKILTVLVIVFAGFCSVVFRGGESIYAIFRTAQLRDFLSGTLSGKIDRAVFNAIPTTALDQADLRTRWPHPGYWRTDTHWDSAGAWFAAEAVAQIINGKLGPGSERINLTSSAMHERPGDLARLAGLMDSPQWLAPAAEYTRDPRAEVQRSGGPLDDAPTPSVILAGSSFSLNSGFIEYLQASLAREVAQ